MRHKLQSKTINLLPKCHERRLMTIKVKLMVIKSNLLQFQMPTLNLWGGIEQKNAKLSPLRHSPDLGVFAGKLVLPATGGAESGITET